MTCSEACDESWEKVTSKSSYDMAQQFFSPASNKFLNALCVFLSSCSKKKKRVYLHVEKKKLASFTLPGGMDRVKAAEKRLPSMGKSEKAAEKCCCIKK